MLYLLLAAVCAQALTEPDYLRELHAKEQRHYDDLVAGFDYLVKQQTFQHDQTYLLVVSPLHHISMQYAAHLTARHWNASLERVRITGAAQSEFVHTLNHSQPMCQVLATDHPEDDGSRYRDVVDRYIPDDAHITNAIYHPGPAPRNALYNFFYGDPCLEIVGREMTLLNDGHAPTST